MQFEIEAQKKECAAENGLIIVAETAQYVTISCNNTEYIFDKIYGRIHDISKNSTSLLKEPAKFKIWHAPTYNVGSCNEW